MSATTWKTDPTHTDVQFSAKHMMVTTVHGKFTAVEGTLELDVEHPARSNGSFTVETASINSGVEQRDGHLRSADFFDAERYPLITFVSTAVEAKNETDFVVTGDLTIRDTTKPVTFDVEFLGLYNGFKGRRAGFHAATKLNREEWGLTWNVGLEAGGWLVGKEIKLEIDLAMDEVVAATADTKTAEAVATTA